MNRKIFEFLGYQEMQTVNCTCGKRTGRHTSGTRAAQIFGLGCTGDLEGSSFQMGRAGEKLKSECERRSKRISYIYLNYFLFCDIIK